MNLDNVVVFYYLSASDIWPIRKVAFGGRSLIIGGLKTKNFFFPRKSHPTCLKRICKWHILSASINDTQNDLHILVFYISKQIHTFYNFIVTNRLVACMMQLSK